MENSSSTPVTYIKGAYLNAQGAVVLCEPGMEQKCADFASLICAAPMDAVERSDVAMLRIDLGLAKLTCDQLHTRLKLADYRIEQLETQVALLEEQTEDDKVYEPGCSPSIMDADGFPQIMADVIRSNGSAHSLTNMYLAIDNWGETQRQYASSQVLDAVVEFDVEAPSETPAFTVQLDEMTESHRVTHWVRLTNNALRPKNLGLLDEAGQITPYVSESREQAIHTASEWAQFLGVPNQVECSCILCEVRST